MMRLFPQPLAVTVAGLAAVWAAGCSDSLASGDYAPVYLTLAGHTTGTQPSGPTRIVVLWQNDNGASLTYTGQLGVYRTDLGTFTLGLNALPPAPAAHALTALEAAASGVDPRLRYAEATLVIFNDGNDNGQLDLVDGVNETSPDQVLGATTNADLFLLLQGRPTDPAQFLDLFPTTDGFSLVQRPTTIDPTFFDCGFYDSRGRHETKLCFPKVDPAHPAVILPLTTQLVVDLPSDEAGRAALQGYTCRGFWGPQDYPDTALLTIAEECNNPAVCSYCVGEDCPLDVPPANATVSCNGDGTAYVYKLCTPDPTRCNTRFCHYGHGERLATDPPPTGWPCS